MNYHTLQPSPELADAVEQIWIYEGYKPPHRLERVFPSGTVELVINLMDGELRCYDSDGRPTRRFREPIVTGVHRGCFIIDTMQQHDIMGVHFKPGGAYRLLGLPLGELADAHVGMQALLGAEAQRLMDVLWSTDSPRERLHAVEGALRRHLLADNHPAVRWAAEQFCRYPDSARIADIADEAGLSLRRFNELFTREIGINPKGFVRIRRFQATLARVHSAGRIDWAVLAPEMGYADQAHLIRDFREFAGITPTAYLALRPAGMNHVPLAEHSQICPVPVVR